MVSKKKSGGGVSRKGLGPVGEMDAAVAAIRAQIPSDKRIVFVSGDFNVIHPGHLRLLNFAATCGDVLVVGVNGDGLGRTLVAEDLRLDTVCAIGVVDHAVLLKVPPASFITRLRPHVVVKGKEHSHYHNPELDAVLTYGGKLIFSSGDIGFSSMDLLRRSVWEINFADIRKPMDYPQRHGFTLDDLADVVARFSTLRVLVVGDLIVDEYIDCEALGMSREDPTLVVSPIVSNKFLGGAGIVAGHACSLGGRVFFVSVCGCDEARDFARERLEAIGVECILIEDETRPTTLKQRFRAGSKTLLRVSHLRQHDISANLVETVFEQVEAKLANVDLVIFSDFNYGCLPQSLVERIAARCVSGKPVMVADSQASSQIGDVSRFHGMKLLTPTEYEARLATRDFQSGLVVLASELMAKAKAENVIVTLGGEGMLIHSPSGADNYLETDRLPALNAVPRDVSGAGDSFLTCAALALTAGADIWAAAYLGSVAAACQVGRVGNLPLAAEEILKELRK